MPIFIPVSTSGFDKITIINNDSDLNGTYLRSDSEYFKRVGIVNAFWQVEDDSDPARAVTFEPYFYNNQNNVSIVHAEGTNNWKFLKGNWSDSEFVSPFEVNNLLYDDSDFESDFSLPFNADSDEYNPVISLISSVGGGSASFTKSATQISKLFVNDNGVVRRIFRLWTFHNNAPRLIFKDRTPASTTFFPLSNTATDPTDSDWRDNNPGYTFTPNVGITTVSPMTNARQMFLGNTTFNDPDVALWDTSSITNMESMFENAADFNQDIDSWDTSNVTNMSSMFRDAHFFSKNLNNWNTSSVTDMSYMFSGGLYQIFFSGDISSWDVSNVTTMAGMFLNTAAFNEDIDSWDTSNVTNMFNMFNGANLFNRDISGWDVDAVTNATNFSLNADQKGTGGGNWIEAEHPSNTALGNFYNL